ncbi:LacI family transcriptional regulator [Kineosporia rhizophila]|uniref:LacI family DNA-binding transcriptional regulator n=1 Tax=Kineosporia TaxID=49184 RepID=UPI001E327249|nr:MULTISPECIES: LacI family DNA-binding transcriptional regulator [Kineosporia]MCE0540500.1 LacI family transcriptional regulator [Kineosporia rhizophila]GLY18993.1 LacI family transcriptional regulator [Kineosporia sp. NBRC 101677]
MSSETSTPRSGPGAAPRRAGIADVAALAGVSVGTASKALNGRGNLREETRARVRAAAEQLEFAPSTVARSLLTGRTFTVGIITTDSYGRFSIPIMRGAEDALGLGEMLAFLCDSREDPIREQHHIRRLLERRVDGIIVAGRRTDARAPIGTNLPVPVVYALAPSDDPDDISVTSDEPGAARLAIDHLVRTGRRRIAHITGPHSHSSSRVRAASAIETLRGHGLELVGDPWFGSWSEAWGRFAVGQLMRSDPDVDGIFCGADVIARGTTDALRESGVTLPTEVGVVGVDNWVISAEAARPPLTTVDLGLHELGRRAGELLIAAIDGSPAPGTHTVPGHLVVRES